MAQPALYGSSAVDLVVSGAASAPQRWNGGQAELSVEGTFGSGVVLQLLCMPDGFSSFQLVANATNLTSPGLVNVYVPAGLIQAQFVANLTTGNSGVHAILKATNADHA